MVTFYELGALGRLGNQLFQYAALRSLGLSRGYDVKIPDPTHRNWHGQSCLLNNFNIESELLEEGDVEKIRHLYREPDYMNFDKNFFNIPDDTNLSGFFQSIYYFEQFEAQIKRELTPSSSYLRGAALEIENLRVASAGAKIVSLHLRRGDNTDNTDPGQVALNNFYGVAGNSKLAMDSPYGRYIESALEIFHGENVRFLVFSGGSRTGNNTTDMEWCKRSFSGDKFLFSEGRSPMEDFSLIMSCDHNIISHVSSFGWWAAFLNQNEDKKVIAPRKYHPDRNDIDYRPGFYPKEWILV